MKVFSLGLRPHRIRSLLDAGKPDWDLLATVTPRDPPRLTHDDIFTSPLFATTTLTFLDG
jgi:hypothetical protein